MNAEVRATPRESDSDRSRALKAPPWWLPLLNCNASGSRRSERRKCWKCPPSRKATFVHRGLEAHGSRPNLAEAVAVALVAFEVVAAVVVIEAGEPRKARRICI